MQEHLYITHPYRRSIVSQSILALSKVRTASLLQFSINTFKFHYQSNGGLHESCGRLRSQCGLNFSACENTCSCTGTHNSEAVKSALEANHEDWSIVELHIDMAEVSLPDEKILDGRKIYEKHT
ncbi:unnamed protein product [Phytophthora fragariaefolia]|uniref:Unnamed protein product n=1 Tax=Phytophthora fragariaefolia TaxID=1490495 RepID=A0A9W7DBH7_9STRA|nr:unnamed protein product [Phytophthora fragariaefolia]